MTTPAIAVVVSAFNRSSLLPALISGLKQQTCPDFEAFLVDNGSTDDTYDVLARLTDGDDRFHVLRVEDNAGPARARNTAWRRASAPLVAFTDDDCAPAPSWLEELVRASSGADIIQGCTLWAEREPGQQPRWFDRSQSIKRWSDRFETCNLLIPRAVLERVGGFDEQFPIAMGEDVDVGLRAVATGATTAFAPEAIVHHHVWSFGFREYLEQRRRYAEIVQLMKVNPAARGLLRWGYVLRAVHLLQWALVPVTIGSIWAGVPWVTPVVVVLWAARFAHGTRYKPFSAPKRFLYSLVQFVGFAYETVCFAAASVRYRTLVI